MPTSPLGESAVVHYLRGLFGGDFEESDGEVTVDTTATRVVKSDPEAISLTIVNLGSQDAYLKAANDPSNTSGFLVAASGGNLSVNVRDDATLPSKEWFAVVTTGTTDLYFTRVRRYAAVPGT